MPKKTLPNLLDVLPSSRTQADLIVEGDAGIVLKQDGSFKVFSTGKADLHTDPETWGEYEMQQMEIGRKLMALSVALSTPELMSVLEDAASGLIDAEAFTAWARQKRH